ncbi:MAG TPA: PqqD family protein [Pyrinomonadaceae bacterium]|nr:PqqD family protein [Pyrinomonadaceae bacterium]
MSGMDYQTPRARTDQIIFKELADETLVYDESRNEAHCLNRTAAFIWKHCDGRTSVAKMVRLLERETKMAAQDQVVWFALGQLHKSHLLEEPLAGTVKPARISRRDAIRALGIAAAVSLPLVTSIVAPTAADAASCGGQGTPCQNNSNCCPNCSCDGFCFCNNA